MSEYAVKLEGVGKSYPHFELADIDLLVPQGQMMGLIGPNGAGKSTTMRIIMGLVGPDLGTVEVLGRSMPRDQVVAKRDIGYATEDMRLYPNATLQWHMDFMASIYSQWDDAYARHLCTQFDVRPEQKMKGVSHGQRVKAGLLLVLARRPKLLVLDEPTTGLDPVARREVLDELMEILLSEERSVLFSSHNTRDVEQLSDQITFVDRGRVVAQDDKETYLENWRRIRIEQNDDFELPASVHVVETTRSGHLTALIIDRFDPDLPAALQNAGAKVHDVDRMTLEEIFVSTVAAARKGGST